MRIYGFWVGESDGKANGQRQESREYPWAFSRAALEGL